MIASLRFAGLHPACMHVMTSKSSFRILLVLLLAATSTAAFAAKPNNSASPLPKDPAALLALAAQHNGLAGPNLQPWHIKATYQLYDAKGNPTTKGTFEEWWQNAKEYKITFHGPSGHTQLVTNAKGTFVEGNDAIQYPEYLVRHLFVEPVTTRLPGKGMKLHINMEEFGKARLECLEEIPKGLQPTGFHVLTPAFPTYCMEPSTPTLRIDGSYGQSMAEIVNIGTLEGRYVPLDAVIFDNGTKYLSIHLDKGETAPQWSPALFTARPGARLEPNFSGTIPLKNQKIMAGNKIGGKNPLYPESAKEHQQQGTVNLAAVIGEDGHIRSLVVTDAPAISLAESALAAVKTWKYKPYFLNGRPVSVRTKITVIYSLGSTSQFGDGR